MPIRGYGHGLRADAIEESALTCGKENATYDCASGCAGRFVAAAFERADRVEQMLYVLAADSKIGLCRASTTTRIAWRRTDRTSLAFDSWKGLQDEAVLSDGNGKRSGPSAPCLCASVSVQDEVGFAGRERRRISRRTCSAKTTKTKCASVLVSWDDLSDPRWYLREDDVAVRYERLDRTETLFLFGLAVTYENKRSEMGRFATVDSDMNELLSLLCVTYRAFEKEPPISEVRRSMSRFERAGIVARKRGRWSDLDVEFAILPAIAHVADRATIDAYEKRYAAPLDAMGDGVMDDDGG
ncbi:MAG: hypothetical protein ACLTQI_01470 [Slackia sp.]